jgi:multiple antibiotic resistance protein
MELVILLQTLVTFFIVFDPIGTLPVFVELTKGFKNKEKAKAANKAVLVAGILAFIFIFFGKNVLDFMGITLNSFKIAGGLVLFLLGIEMILDFSFSKNKAKNYSVAASIIAVPIITGPGVITTSILMVNQIGIAITSISVLLCLLIIWILLMASLKIQGKLGETNLNIISKVMGLIIASYGIKLIIAVFGF